LANCLKFFVFGQEFSKILVQLNVYGEKAFQDVEKSPILDFMVEILD